MSFESTGKADRIRERAHALGFELVGLAPAHPVPDFDFFRWWLDRGYAATMTYLHRQAERRGDPGRVLEGARTVICLGLNYFTGAAPGDVIARYAHGSDYHRVLGGKLAALEGFIVSLDPTARTRSYVDTGPVLERSYGARAGLGWIGKNTMLINEGLGSYFFLGEILTTMAFEASDYGRPALDQCGTCTRCLEACPTGALPEPGVLDAKRCVSYLTIEYRGDFTPEQEGQVGGHAYGCDVCQEVCPYNDRIPTSLAPEFQPRAAIRPVLEGRQASEADFEALIPDSAMDRITAGQWRRNLRAISKPKV